MLHRTTTTSRMSGASNAPGRPSARHSLPVMSGCSIVQNGASSASLKRLSLEARDQVSSQSPSSALPYVNVQCAPADRPQRDGLCPASVQLRRLLDDLDRARLQDLHTLASLSQGVRCVSSMRSGASPILVLKTVQRPVPPQGARAGKRPLAERPPDWMCSHSCHVAAYAAQGATVGRCLL